LFAGGRALEPLWLWWVAPIVRAVVVRAVIVGAAIVGAANTGTVIGVMTERFAAEERCGGQVAFVKHQAWLRESPRVQGSGPSR